MYSAHKLQTGSDIQPGFNPYSGFEITSAIEPPIFPSIIKDFGRHFSSGINTASGTVPSATVGTRANNARRGVDPLPKLPLTEPVSRPTLIALQEWEGVVIEVNDNRFLARLIDLSDRTRTGDEEADFSTTEVSDDDRLLLRAGAVFRWIIGFQKLPGGTKQRISQLVFRRLPQWTREDIARADETTNRWSAILNERR